VYKPKHRHHHPPGPDGEDFHHGFHRPFWKHAHHDWRLVVAVCLMLAAVALYLMSDDLAWRPRHHPRQPLSGVSAKSAKVVTEVNTHSAYQIQRENSPGGDEVRGDR